MDTRQRLKYIDVLRVLAMIPVMVCHYTRSLEYAGVGFVNKILPDTVFSIYLGGVGVAIFFVISGASLMYTYDGKFETRKYVKKRILGIYPMYYMAWLAAFLYLFYKNRGFLSDVPKVKILLTLFGMDGYANWYGKNFYLLGEWFLGCLIFLYILFPLLKYAITKHPLITGVIISVIYIVVPYFYSGTIPAENFFVFRIPEFAFGMYFVYYKPDLKWPAALGTVIVLICTCVFNITFIPVLYRNTVVGIAYLLLSYIYVNILNAICFTGYAGVLESMRMQYSLHTISVFRKLHITLME